MPASRFFDTNILIYAFSEDHPRTAPAEALLAGGGIIGVQVLNEFANVARRKLGWDWERIQSALGVIEELVGAARPVTAAIHSAAVNLARDHKLSFYDALIAAAALDARCRLLYSEDFQHGRKFGSLTIENPFLD
jgi:predicted nucleic acid-binding protein